MSFVRVADWEFYTVAFPALKRGAFLHSALRALNPKDWLDSFVQAAGSASQRDAM
jgi:hypothetical protein